MKSNSDPDEKTPESRSPTETLVSCLEDFGKSEPTKAFVIYVNVDGDICWSSSGPFSYSQTLGMLECVKARVLTNFLKD